MSVQVIYKQTEAEYNATNNATAPATGDYLLVLCGDLLTSKIYYNELGTWQVKDTSLNGDGFTVSIDDLGDLIMHINNSATGIDVPISEAHVKGALINEGLDWAEFTTEISKIWDETLVVSDVTLVEWLLTECFHYTGDVLSSRIPTVDYVRSPRYKSLALVSNLLGCQQFIYDNVYVTGSGFDFELAEELVGHKRHRKQNLSKEPVGSIVQGDFVRFGLDIPDNLFALDGSMGFVINNPKAHPSLQGVNIGTDYRGRSLAVPNVAHGYSVGLKAGATFVTISKSMLPTNTFQCSTSASLYAKNGGKVDLSFSDDYNGDPKIYTSTDSHNHKMWGDSAGGVTSSNGSWGSDLVLNNNDGRQRADYWYTDSDSHSHYITANSIMNKLGVNPNDFGVSSSASFRLNTDTYQTSMDNRQQTRYTETYLVIY